jgi:hypothetical protein
MKNHTDLPDLASLNSQRRCAETTWMREEVLDSPDGWSLSKTDPRAMLDCFRSLRLRDNWNLIGYQFRERNNANGLVLPVPIGTPHAHFLANPPAIAGADGIPPLMRAITGDGSFESYLAASLFYRECREFGAMGHGIDWLDHHLLNNECWINGVVSHNLEPLGLRKEQWEWLDNVENFEPSVSAAAAGRIVSLFTYQGRMDAMIVRHSDTFLDGYEFQTSTKVIARPYRVEKIETIIQHHKIKRVL